MVTGTPDVCCEEPDMGAAGNAAFGQNPAEFGAPGTPPLFPELVFEGGCVPGGFMLVMGGRSQALMLAMKSAFWRRLRDRLFF